MIGRCNRASTKAIINMTTIRTGTTAKAILPELLTENPPRDSHGGGFHFHCVVSYMEFLLTCYWW